MKAGLLPRAWAAIGFLAALLPAQSIDVALQLPPSLTFGAPFEVVVTRRWPAGTQVEAFDPAQLAPLTLAPAAVELLADGERRHYVARAFVAGQLTLPPVTLRWLEGDAVRSVSCTPTPFAVASILPEPAGEPEWPGDVLELPHDRRVVWLAMLVAGGVLMGGWWWRRSRAVAAVLSSPTSAAWSAARELDRLVLPMPGEDTTPFFTALKSIVREHCQRRYALPAPMRTSEELVAAVQRDGGNLRAALQLCDLVLFAAVDTTSAEAALGCARGFVGESS